MGVPSMGATSAILCGEYRGLEIASMVLDSPFSTLEKVIHNVSVKEKFPSLVFSIAMYFVKRRVIDIVGMDIFNENFAEALLRFVVCP